MQGKEEYNKEDYGMDEFDLSVDPIETNKKKIFINNAMKQNIICKHPCSAIFNGKTASGKTVLLTRLLLNKGLYKDYFHKIYLFTRSPDDSFDQLPKDKLETFTNVRMFDAEIDKILQKQVKIIEKNGIHKSPRILFIFEDIINEQKWLRSSPNFRKLFIANRHYNASTFVTCQSWTSLLRAIRVNASQIYIFGPSGSEIELLVEEYRPSSMTKNEFRRLISFTTQDQFSFLSINNKMPPKEKFRKGLDILIKIP